MLTISVVIVNVCVVLMCYCVCTLYSAESLKGMHMPLYDYLTPKLDFKCKFNHHQSFRYKGRLTVRTI